MRIVELSPANRNSANEVSVSPSHKSSMSSKLEKLQQSPPKGSHNENEASRDGLQKEDNRLGHHVRVINSTDSDAYSRNELKRGSKTSETPTGIQSSWSESGSDTLSCNECDISSARSKYGGIIKKPG